MEVELWSIPCLVFEGRFEQLAEERLLHNGKQLN